MIRLYNFLSRKKEVFRPIKKRTVGFYTCGPTVYDRAHIGNLRTFVLGDILHRTLEMNGYKMRRIMNITDIDDKIIKKAEQEKKTTNEIAKHFTRAFFEDVKKLNIKKADVYPRATEHINEMIVLIQRLIKKGIAYKCDGSVYFNISKFRNYGKLSGVKNLKAGVRMEKDEYGKEDVQDFALWKEYKKGEPWWNSPFGKGRPGWHIECSAMSMKYLGQPFDIHSGAVDLLFPHHENEIAQSEAASGKKFVNFWVEGEHLLVNGKKMAKSLGNFFTLKDLEERGFRPLALRYLALTAHYRSPLNFTWESLRSAENALNKIYDFIKNTSAAKKSEKEKKILENFKAAFNNDLDSPGALAIMWRVIKEKKIAPKEKKRLLFEFDEILGLGLKRASEEKIKIPPKIKKLVEKREKLRSLKKWEEADLLRKEMRELGWSIRDTASEPKLERS